MQDKFFDIEQIKKVSRRHFLLESAAGLGAAALDA
jgi:hypothetical protein